jgi:hypothetical protein
MECGETVNYFRKIFYPESFSIITAIRIQIFSMLIIQSVLGTRAIEYVPCIVVTMCGLQYFDFILKCVSTKQ